MSDFKPETYWEQPDHRPIAGEAVQFDGSSNSAIDISQWLETKGITAYVAPGARNLATMMIPDAADLMQEGIVFTHDWVLVEADGTVRIIRDMKMNRHFRKEGDTRPPYWAELQAANHR